MEPLSEDAELRRLLQRIRAVDQQTTPSFQQVLQRPRVILRRPVGQRSQLAAVAAVSTVAVMLLITVWGTTGLWQSAGHPGSEPQVVVIAPSAVDNRLTYPTPTTQLELQSWNRLVERHFEVVQSDRMRVSVWSSRTDSLIAWNLPEAFGQD